MFRILLVVMCVFAFCCGPAVADLVSSVPLAFDTDPSGDTNSMDLKVWAGGTVDTGIFGNQYISSSDTETTTVSGNMIVDLDCTFDPITHEVTSVTGMNFNGGVFNFTTVNFDLKFTFSILTLGHVYANGSGIGGTFNTVNPFPPSNVTGNTNFNMTDHEVVINQGLLDMTADGIVGNYVEPMSFDLSDPNNWMYATANGTGTISVVKQTGSDDTYDVHVLIPLDIDELLYDDGSISATLQTTETAYFATTGSFTVVPANNPPIAVNDLYSTNEDIPYSAGIPGVLLNDSDPDSDPITAYEITDAVHGSVVVNDTGDFTYTPNPNFNGLDSFTYKAFDGSDWSEEATVTIDVIAVNDAPTVLDDYYECDEGGMVNTYPYDGVEFNDYDIDNSTFTVEKMSDPSNGSLSFYSSGAFRYIPAAGFVGSDSFTYRAYDGTDYSDLATVYLTVVGHVPGDATGNGIVDSEDAEIVAQYWGQSVTGADHGDFNGDGVVNAKDASIMAANWGDHTESVAPATPEPSSLMLIFAGLLAVCLQRKRTA